MRRAGLIIPAIIVAIVIAMSSIFIVDEREKVLVLQFGRIVQKQEDPGLGFKIPLIQEVVRYDDRILSLDTPEIEVTPSDGPAPRGGRLCPLPDRRCGALPSGRWPLG